MLPISLGGTGIGEGAFVYCAGLFGITSGKSVPVALVILAVSTTMSLLGGVLLLRRTLCEIPLPATRVAPAGSGTAKILSYPTAATETEAVFRRAT
jgi:hypothetical protein